MKLVDILIEVLTLQEYDPFSKIERNPKGINNINYIFDRIKKIIPNHHESSVSDKDSFPPYVESKDGDRLYVPFETKEDDVDSPVKWIVSNKLKQLGYSLVNYKNGLAKNDKSGQIVKIGKVLSKYGDNDDESRPIKTVLNKFTEDPVRNSARSDDFMIVFSKHPYDIAGMSTDRGWTSCQKINGRSHSDNLYCGVREGTIVIYLVKGDDYKIEKPLARTLAKQYVNERNPKDIMYVVSGIYGNPPAHFIPYTKTIFDEINKEKIGEYRYNSGLYNDERNKIYKYNLKYLIAHPEYLQSDMLTHEDKIIMITSNVKSVVFIGSDLFLSEDEIKTILKKDNKFFNKIVNGQPVIEWVGNRTRGAYFNVMMGSPKYYQAIERFGDKDFSIAFTTNQYPVFINRSGHIDATSVNIDLDNAIPIRRAAYYNTLLNVPKFFDFGKFGVFGGDIAYVRMVKPNGSVGHCFINRDLNLDITGVDPTIFNNSPMILTEYFNQKLNTDKFLEVRKINKPDIFISFVETPGKDFESTSYFMDADGNPTVKGIEYDDIKDNTQSAYNTTVEMIQGKRLQEIRISFNRFEKIFGNFL